MKPGAALRMLAIMTEVADELRKTKEETRMTVTALAAIFGFHQSGLSRMMLSNSVQEVATIESMAKAAEAHKDPRIRALGPRLRAARERDRIARDALEAEIARTTPEAPPEPEDADKAVVLVRGRASIARLVLACEQLAEHQIVRIAVGAEETKPAAPLAADRLESNRAI